ncbi:hypothetical protein [Brachybacterium sp. GCM10030252]|uniref:hypothetical protein n=1 Tax=Brachybacterium sp. GCM10030252 TaxID=3273380 RepID=UPI003621FFE5
MRPIATIRERTARLVRVPGAVRRRSGSAATRAKIVADARALVPDIPRDADAGHLVRAARRLVRRAAQDEFAREGVRQVRLPEGWGRTELRRADVPGDASFHAFVEETLAAIDIAPGSLERDDALELRDAPTSSDGYGLSPEVASDLASYLLGLARELTAADEQELEPQDEFFAGHATRIREDVRGALIRQVRVPLELKVALDRHERIEGGEPDPVLDTEDFTSQAGGPGDADATEEERRSFAQRAQAAYDFAQSEAGRAAFSMLRSGAERAYEMYGQRPAGGKTSSSDKSSDKTTGTKRPPRG